MPQRSAVTGRITSSTAATRGSPEPESAKDGTLASTSQASSHGTPGIKGDDEKVQGEDLTGLGSQFENEWPMEPSVL
ncbi:hypothetical protein ACHAP5_007170 [Fusarium lateritium]